MSKYRLEWEDDSDFIAIGIASHQKDYRLAWALNKALDCSFIRLEDYKSVGKTPSRHAFFKWSEPEGHYSFWLLANRGEEAFLLPELKQADYLLVIEGMTDMLDIQSIQGQVKKIDTVLTAFEIDQTKTKSIQNIVVE